MSNVTVPQNTHNLFSLRLCGNLRMLALLVYSLPVGLNAMERYHDEEPEDPQLASVVTPISSSSARIAIQALIQPTRSSQSTASKKVSKPRPQQRQPKKQTEAASNRTVPMIVTRPNVSPALDLTYDNPLYKALMVDNLKFLQKALNNKAITLETRGSFGRQALHIVARSCSKNIVRFLSDNGAPLNALDDDQKPPLYHALAAFISPLSADMRVRAKEIILFLVWKGAYLGNDQIEWLQEYKGLIRCEKLFEEYPLLGAIFFKDYDTVPTIRSVTELDRQGALLYATTDRQTTSLDVITRRLGNLTIPEVQMMFGRAAWHGNDEVITYLAESLNQLDLESRSMLVFSAAQQARAGGHMRIAEFLETQASEIAHKLPLSIYKT